MPIKLECRTLNSGRVVVVDASLEGLKQGVELGFSSVFGNPISGEFNDLEDAVECIRILNKPMIALEELIKYNQIHNDLESYLFEIALWGLGQRSEKPQLEVYR